MSKVPPPPDHSAKKRKSNGGNISCFFKKEHDEHSSACEFVLQNHESIEPVGFKMLRRDAAAVSEQLDLAVVAEEWTEARSLKLEFDSIFSSAELEEKLYNKSIFCIPHNRNRYELFSKKRDLDKLEYYSNLINESVSYLTRVPDEDKVVDALSVDSDSDQDDSDIATAQVVFPGDEDADEEEADVVVIDPTGPSLPLPPLPHPKIPNMFRDEDDEIVDDVDDADEMPFSAENNTKEGIGDSEYLPDKPVKKSLRSHFNTKG